MQGVSDFLRAIRNGAFFNNATLETLKINELLLATKNTRYLKMKK